MLSGCAGEKSTGQCEDCGADGAGEGKKRRKGTGRDDVGGRDVQRFREDGLAVGWGILHRERRGRNGNWFCLLAEGAMTQGLGDAVIDSDPRGQRRV